MRATLDPVTSLTGDATQVSELQSRLQLHPANARLQGDLGIAYLQRARETNDPSYYTKAQTLLERSLDARSRRTRRHDRRGLARALLPRFPRGAAARPARARALARLLAAGARDDRRRLGRARPLRAGLRRVRAPRRAAPRARRLRAPQLLARAAGRRRRRDPAHAPRRRRGLGRAREHAVDARAAGGAAAQVGPRRRRRQGVPPRARAAARTTRAPRPASAPSPSRAATSPRPSAGTTAPPRTCRCPTSSRSSATCARRAATRPARRRPTRSSASRRRSSSAPAATPISRRRSSTPRTPARCSRAAVVALARKALAFRPSVYGHDALAWALYSAGKCRQALPQAMLANRLGTIDPQLSWHLGAIAACAGKRGARPHGAAQGARAHAALPPARRPGGAAPAGEALVSGRRQVAPRRVPLASPLRVALACAAALTRGREAHPLGNFTVNQYTRLDVAPGGRLGALRARHGRDPDVPAAAASSTSNGDGRIAAAEAARESKRLVAIVAPHLQLTADGKPVRLALETAHVAFPHGPGRALDDAPRRALPRRRARARQRAAHVRALEHATRPIASAGASCSSRAAAASRCARPTRRSATARTR